MHMVHNLTQNLEWHTLPRTDHVGSPQPISPSQSQCWWQRWSIYTALAGLFAFAAGASGAKALQGIGMLLMILGSIPFLNLMWRRLARDPLTVAVVAFFTYLIFSALTAGTSSVEGVEHWDLVRKMSRVLLLPVVAYWLAGRQDRISWFFGIALLGTIGPIFEQWLYWGSITPMFGAERIGFRLNPIWMGLNASLAVLGLVVFRAPIVSALARRLSTPGALATWTLLFLLMIQVVVVSQSRGAYVALAAGASLLAILKIRHVGLRSLLRQRTQITFTIVFLVFVLAMLLVQDDVLVKRLIDERGTIVSIMNGDFSNLPMTPIGQRLFMYMAGLEAWMQKPWLGWGPDGSLVVIAQADMPKGIVHDHVHNGILDVLVRFGIIGAVIFYSIPVILIRAAWRSFKAGWLQADIGHFVLVAIATFAIADMTESYIASGHGWSLLMLIGGVMYTGYLWNRPARTPDSRSD